LPLNSIMSADTMEFKVHISITCWVHSQWIMILKYLPSIKSFRIIKSIWTYN